MENVANQVALPCLGVAGWLLGTAWVVQSEGIEGVFGGHRRQTRSSTGSRMRLEIRWIEDHTMGLQLGPRAVDGPILDPLIPDR